MITLDVGAGKHCRGDICVDISLEGGTDTGILNDELGLEYRPDGMFVLADAHMLPFRSNAFDRVLLIHVLEHLECPSHALKEMMRVLKPFGMLTVVVPNAEVSMADYVDPTHIYSFTVASLVNLLGRVGYVPVRVDLIHSYVDIRVDAVKVG